MEINGKNFLVYGTGVSGLSAYNFLKSKGANVCIYSDRKTKNLQEYNVITKFTELENIVISVIIWYNYYVNKR